MASVEDTQGMDRRPRVSDAVVALILLAAMVANSALAPTNTPAHSQWRQMKAAIGTIESGDWLLPRNQIGDAPSKGPLMAWLTVPLLKATGVYNDFVYRVPAVAAAAGMVLLVYLLGTRWYGRRAGLLAAAFWATGMHMGHLIYLCTTDMLVTFWMTLSVFCADRLLFHRRAGQRNALWAGGLWVSMILAGLTRGLGIVNLVMVGGMFALAAAAGPGFAPLARARSLGGKLALAARLVGRRWHRAARQTGAIWGLPLFVGAMALLLTMMFLRGREAFGGRFLFEIAERVVSGEDAPRGGSIPPVLGLLYLGLPGSLLMFAALLQVPLRRWLRQPGPLALPLCWILSVVLPFSFTHGFRPDYLLPCYAATALLAARGVESLAGLPERARRGGASLLRHLVAAAPVVIGLALVVVSAVCSNHDAVWAACQRYGATSEPFHGLARCVAVFLQSGPPPFASAEVRWLGGVMPILGAAVLAVAVRASLQWRIRRLALLAVVGMLGLMFMDRHFLARYARSGDGEKAVAFAKAVRACVGSDPFAVHRVCTLATEPYLGRFGANVRTIEQLRASGAKWLVTTDLALRDLCLLRQASRPASGEITIGRSGLEEALERVGGVEEYRYVSPIEDEGMSGEFMLLIKLTGNSSR